MDFKRITDMLENGNYWVESVKIQRAQWDIKLTLRCENSRVRFTTNYPIFEKFQEDSLKATELLQKYGKWEGR